MAERDQDEEDNAGGPPRGALIGLVVIVVLVIGVVFIMQRLHQADSLQDCVAFQGVGTVRLIDQAPNVIFCLQCHRDQRRVGGNLTLPHAIECSLDVMREIGHGVEAEHRAGAFDGVQRPEGGVHQVGVARHMLEIQQRLLQLVKQFRGFLPIELGGISAAHAPSTLRTTASNCSC